MNFKPIKFYSDIKTIFTGVKAETVEVKKTFNVYFKEKGGLSIIKAQGAFDHEDAILFTKEVMTGNVNSKQAFLTVIQGGKQ